MERNVELGMLLACYGRLLTERQQTLLSLHVDADFSLAEIAEQTGISRQGVHDVLRRAEAQLRAMETHLRLLYRSMDTQRRIQEMREALQNIKLPEESRKALLAMLKDWAESWEE